MDFARIRNALQRPYGRREEVAAVLMYHRVDEVEHDVWGLAVHPSRFVQHLDVVRSRYRPARLSGLAEDLARGAIASRTVVVTFDDGYRDNLEVAKPLLVRYEVPATVFVATACLTGSQSFWWDDLVEICFAGDALPEWGEVVVTDGQVEWNLSKLVGLGVPADSQTAREAVCRALREQLLTQSNIAIHELVHDLRRLARLRPATGTLMDADEVVRLQDDGLVDVGAHTVNHSSLPTLTRDEKLDEIGRSKVELEQLLGRPVKAFSYPYGDVDAETVECVRETGFTCAVTVAEQPVVRWSDSLELPRLYVGDWTADEFTDRLDRFLKLQV